MLASEQLVTLSCLVLQLQANSDEVDSWSYPWPGSNFMVTKAYIFSKGIILISLVFKWMWHSQVAGEIKFFFWLLLKDRLNTRGLLRRKNMYLDEYTCVLCQLSAEETLEHLFFECPFSYQCWQQIGIQWITSVNIVERIVQARFDFGLQSFREIAMLAAWCIWNHRNAIIFGGDLVSMSVWVHLFKQEFGLLLHQANPSLKLELDSWFCNTF